MALACAAEACSRRRAAFQRGQEGVGGENRRGGCSILFRDSRAIWL